MQAHTAFVVAGSFFLTAIAHATGPRGHGFSAWDFGQAHAESNCPQQESCFETAYQSSGSGTAWAYCYDEDLSIPNCRADFRAGQSFHLDYWTGWAVPCTGDCFPPVTAMSVNGTKQGDLFTLEGFAHVEQGSTMQLAVLHYTGSSNSLATAVVHGLEELVSQGIVSPDQILYSRSFVQPGETDVSAEIPVPGIPITQIVIYGYGKSPPPPGGVDVPATSPVGLIVLAVLFLAGLGFTAKRAARLGPRDW